MIKRIPPYRPGVGIPFPSMVVSAQLKINTDIFVSTDIKNIINNSLICNSGHGLFQQLIHNVLIRNVDSDGSHLLRAILFQKQTDGSEQSKLSVLIMIGLERTQASLVSSLMVQNRDHFPTKSAIFRPTTSELRIIGNGLHSKVQPRSKPDPPCKLAVFENMLYRFRGITTMQAQSRIKEAFLFAISEPSMNPPKYRPKCSTCLQLMIPILHLPKLMKKVTHSLTSIPVCFEEHQNLICIHQVVYRRSIASNFNPPNAFGCLGFDEIIGQDICTKDKEQKLPMGGKVHVVLYLPQEIPRKLIISFMEVDFEGCPPSFILFAPFNVVKDFTGNKNIVLNEASFYKSILEGSDETDRSIVLESLGRVYLRDQGYMGLVHGSENMSSGQEGSYHTRNILLNYFPAVLEKHGAHAIWPRGFVSIHLEKSIFYFHFCESSAKQLGEIIFYNCFELLFVFYPLTIRKMDPVDPRFQPLMVNYIMEIFCVPICLKKPKLFSSLSPLDFFTLDLSNLVTQISKVLVMPMGKVSTDIANLVLQLGSHQS
ncbi:Transposon TX1 uncharacterized 149 kDa protein [Senna tora]|uniref:Transposon TX1 uncharacterized 149 kDa protein n=1 Tax=Senna tora TaxID=362788 RepID=A0A834U086_9FABA|nr:Transposon TX1 uncharacterized 149 kDa protein [Senna tora]